MQGLEHEFIQTLSSITKLDLTQEIWDELRAWYPDQYKGLDVTQIEVKDEMLANASLDYYNIVNIYLQYNEIPITIETLTAGYLVGVKNLKKYGLVHQTNEIKTIMGLMRKRMAPQSEALDNKLKYST